MQQFEKEPEARRERYLMPAERTKLMDVLVDDLEYLSSPIEVSLGTGVRKLAEPTRLRATGVHEYDIQDLLGHAKPGVTKVYTRATLTVLKDAVDKLKEPWGEVIKFERKAS